VAAGVLIGVSDFDRIAWFCSWVAPFGWGIALLAFVLSLPIGTQLLGDPGVGSTLPALAVGAGSLALLAHTIFAYHILKSRRFSPEERNQLWRDNWLGFGYRRWRSVMRRHQG